MENSKKIPRLNKALGPDIDQGTSSDIYDMLVGMPYVQQSFGDFFEVGENKTIAAMDLKTIYHSNGGSAYNFPILQEHAKRNKFTCQFIEGKSGETNDSFFMYDKANLQKILNNHNNILQKYKLPLESDAFITWIGTHLAYYDEMPEISKLIALCYNRSEKKLFKNTA